tara:strand:+ start:413 stop:1135 length:723 start_codon:yes stop_codon:yes gene_type:complete
MDRPKTIFCDIDGTLWNHVGGVSEQSACLHHKLLPNTKDAIDKWDRLGYCIILTTGRKESLRSKTEAELLKSGIVYDKLIMGIGGGVRILINDRKPYSDKNTCYAVNLVRNKGISYYDFTSKFVIIPDEQPKTVLKSWGKEELIEYNDHYIMKKIYMFKDTNTDKQYHELKRKTLYILDGKLKLNIGKDILKLETKELTVGDKITITPNTIYEIICFENCEYLECSTPELGSDIKISKEK